MNTTSDPVHLHTVTKLYVQIFWEQSMAWRNEDNPDLKIAESGMISFLRNIRARLSLRDPRTNVLYV